MSYIIGSIILLGLGLIQSVLELVKDSKGEKYKWARKILPGIYILVFIASGILLLGNYRGNKKWQKIINKISFNIDSIGFKINQQINKLDSSLNNTDSLIYLSDRIGANIDSIIRSNDSLFIQYRLVNNNIDKQITFKQQELKNSGPKLDIITDSNYIYWDKIDSSRIQLVTKLMNNGNREGQIIKRYNLTIFSYKSRVIDHIVQYDNTHAIIYPYSNKVSPVITSGYNILRKSILEKSDIIYIYTRLWYIDPLYKDTLTKSFYFKWTKKHSFVFASDENKKAITDWAKRNNLPYPRNHQNL